MITSSKDMRGNETSYIAHVTRRTPYQNSLIALNRRNKCLYRKEVGQEARKDAIFLTRQRQKSYLDFDSTIEMQIYFEPSARKYI